MTIYDSKLWIADLDETIKSLPELNMLAGKRILITGSTGLICSAIVDVLIRWNETNNDKIGIVCAGRNSTKVEDRFYPHCKQEWFQFVEYDATKVAIPLPLDGCDFIIHGASNASPNKIVAEPVETMISNVVGVHNLLSCAHHYGVKRVLFVSSSEVYGKKEGKTPFKTNEYGYIDLLNSRNSYSVGKRAAETLCVSYADEYGVDSVIVRPGHIYGPTALATDNRVSSVWPRDAALGNNIVMKSDGMQIRSYCYCLDCASAIVKVLLKGETSKAYNISNPDSIISIRDMAGLLAKAAGVRLIVDNPSDNERKGFNPMLNSSLDSCELQSLAWNGLFSAERGFSHTITIMKDILKE